MEKERKEQIDNITASFKDAEISVSPEAAGKLYSYMELVLEKNKELNLTAVTERDEFIREHFVDSASVTRLPEYRDAKTVCDVGTGAGFPGAVLAILSPEKEFTLMDSLSKRLNAVRCFLSELGIENVMLIHGRAEELAKRDDLREAFDLSVSRAVAKLPSLLELTLPFVRVGGSMVSYKGRSAEEEVKKSASAVNILGGETPHILYAGVPGTEHRLVVVRKASKTPGKYPRKPGTPVKKPL